MSLTPKRNHDAFAAPSRAAGHKVTARGAASREKFLKAALEILHESGYAALSISTVCKRAGGSGASLYHHFGDKAGLLGAMVEHSVDESRRLLEQLAASQDTPLEQIDAFITALRDVRMKSPYNTAAVLMALSQACGNSEETADVVRRAQKYVQEAVAARFAELLDIKDATLIAHLHVAFTSYGAQLSQSGTEAKEVDALFESMRAMLLMVSASCRPDFLQDKAFKKAVDAIGARQPEKSI
ncbi:MAG: TetR/AcrR family transcriptional regulator [Pseudomonadota bacterium]